MRTCSLPLATGRSGRDRHRRRPGPGPRRGAGTGPARRGRRRQRLRAAGPGRLGRGLRRPRRGRSPPRSARRAAGRSPTPGTSPTSNRPRELVELAIAEFGKLDILVNNAGILRDRMVFSMTEDEWDSVIRVHLKGHFNTTHFAAAHWRERSKAAGGPVYGRIVNTSSEAFLAGSAGQPNYAAAKGGIVGLTTSTALALAKYGVTANAICPRARTRMTEDVFAGFEQPADGARPARPRARRPARRLSGLTRRRPRQRPAARRTRRHGRGRRTAQGAGQVRQQAGHLHLRRTGRPAHPALRGAACGRDVRGGGGAGTQAGADG